MGTSLKITVAIVLFSALFIGLGSYLSQKEKVVLVSTIEKIFSEAISSDLEKRIDDSGIPFFWGSMDLDYPSQKDYTTVIAENSITYVKKDSTYKDKKVTERMEIMMQGVLAKEGFSVQASVLDSIFADKLQQEGFPLITGVRYTNNQTMEEKEYDPAKILDKSISTQKHLLVESGDISVQGFYTLPFSAVFHRAPLPFILLFIAWLITITGFAVLTLRKKPVEEIAFVAVSDISKPSDSDPFIQVSAENAIYFDPVKSRLYYPTDKFIELSNQAATLFLAFLEAPEHFLTYKQIDHIFWPKQEDTRAVRAQAIKRLREDLSPATQVRVDNINRNGYKLVVVSQE